MAVKGEGSSEDVISFTVGSEGMGDGGDNWNHPGVGWDSGSVATRSWVILEKTLLLSGPRYL